MAIDRNDPDFIFLRKQIQEERAILFLGAGFSFDARNGAGNSPPLGGPLAELLANEAGFPYAGESLPVVYEAVRKQLGTGRLWSLLLRLYDIHGYADWYKIIRQTAWYRIGNHEMRFMRPNRANAAALAEIHDIFVKRRATRL